MLIILIGVLLFNFALIEPSPVKLVKAIGGVEDSIIRFPYQVAMFARFPDGSKFSSGAIISKRHVITCAHCLFGSNSVSIFYGSAKLSNLDFGQNQVVDSVNYRIHPQYELYVNDIAIIMMNSEIVFSGKRFEHVLYFLYYFYHKLLTPSDSVRSLRLPTIGEETRNFEDHTLEMASWGYYSDENVLSDNIRFVKMKIISTEECTKVYAPSLITSSVMCSESSHCFGDSGSMLIQNNNHGEYLAVGIASFSYAGCKERPAVFMRITSYLDFIRGNLDMIDD